MREISILGCGWLGLPLGKVLAENGFVIKGSTTSESKLQLLDDSGIRPFLVSLSTTAVIGNVSGFLTGSDTIIINIPPKTSGGNFTDKIRHLIPLMTKAGITKVLFVSSTSVYGDDETVVTELTTPNPATENGQQLLETERLLQNAFGTTIVRFGGLISGVRHPVKYLAGRKEVENPDAPINLIHRDDCIGIILKILKSNKWDETYNAVAPYHPIRKAYYTQKAVEVNLTPPEFTTSTSPGKIISSDKVIRDLDYQFAKPKL